MGKKTFKKAAGFATGGLIGGGAGSLIGGLGGAFKSATGTGRFSGTKLGSLEKEPFKEKVSGAGTQEELRKKQREQSQRLEERATGQRPSLAEAQMKSAQDRNLAQQIAAAQSRRGGSASVRERELARAQSAAGRQIAQDSATARLQEQQATEQLLANQLQAQRAQDVNIAEADRASAQRLQELLVNENLGIQGLNLSGFQSAAQQRSGLIQSIGSGLAGIAASDKNLKTKIVKEGAEKAKDKLKKEGEDKVKNKKLKSFAEGMQNSSPNVAATSGAGEAALSRAMSKISDENKKKNMKKSEEDFNPKSFLDALQAYSYEYKDGAKKMPEAGEGRFLSVMAQDLEKAGPVGKSMVEDTPNGKIVNYGKGFGAILAAQAHLNKRLEELEKKKKS